MGTYSSKRLNNDLDTFFLKQRISSSYKAQNLLRMLLGSGGGRFVRLRRCRLLSVPSGEQEGGGIAQAWATWPEGASAPNGDKFKIIITLRQAQKFGDTGPYKNFDFLINRLLTAGFRNFS